MDTQQIKNSCRSKRWLMIVLGVFACSKLVFISEVSAASVTQTITQVISDFEDGKLLMQCTAPSGPDVFTASAEISSAQAHSGTQSCRIKLSSGGASIELPFLPKLWGRPIKLSAWIYNQGYDMSMSLELKGSEGERIGFSRLAGSPAAEFIPGWQGWQEVVIDTTGAPYFQYNVFEAADGKLDTPIYLYRLLLKFRGATSETIYLDDISAEQVLAEGTVGSLDFCSDHIGNLFEPQEAVNLTGTLANLSSAPFSGVVHANVFDFFGKQVMDRDFKVKVPPTSAEKFAVNFGKLKRGYYEVHFSAQIAGQEIKDTETFLVLPQREPGDTDIRFGLMGTYPSPKIAKRLGIDLDRGAFNTQWSDMDLGNGKYDFIRAERNYRPTEQAGIVVLAWLLGFPPGLVKEAGLESNPGEAYLIKDIDAAKWQRILDAWETYNRALFTHFKGRVLTYELFNEVQCSAPGEANKRRVAKRVADLTMATARARDAVDPAIKIVSPSIHSEDTEFLKYFFEYCPLNIVSGIAYHCYRSWMWPEGPKVGGFYFPGTLTLKEGLNNFEQFFTDRGVQKEIWQTEMAYWDTTNPWYGPTYVNGKLKTVDSCQQAAYLARLYLIHFSSAHAGPFCWFQLTNDSESPENMVGNSGILRANLTPKRSALAYRTTHDRLNNAKFKKILSNQGVHAYLYRRGATDVLAVWSEFGRRPVGIMGLPAGRMYQLDGNYQEVKEPNLYRFAVDDNPVFFESESSMDKTAVEPLIEVQLPDDIPGESQQITMKVILRNPGAKPWKVKLSPDLPQSITATPTEVRAEVPAGKEETASFQVDLTGLAFDGWATLGVKCNDAILGALNPGKLVTLHFPEKHFPRLKITKTVTPPVIDGVLNDACWEKAAVIPHLIVTASLVPSRPSPIGKEPSNKTIAYLLYDDNYLYLGMECFDKETDKLITSNCTGRDGPWGDDGVEIFLDPSKSRKTYFQILINANGIVSDWKRSESEGDLNWNNNSLVKVGKSKDKWRVEARISLASFELTPTTISKWGLNIVRYEPREHLVESWAPVGDNNLQADKLGFLDGLDLVYPDYCYQVENLSWGSGNVGANKVEFEIKNISETRRDILARIEYEPEGGQAYTDTKLVSIPLLQSQKVSLDYRSAAQQGAGKLCLSIEDPKTKKAYWMKTTYLGIPAN